MVEQARTKCPATNREGQPCKSRLGPGQIVCYHHGGNLPRVKAAATLRISRDKAQQELITRMKTAKTGRLDLIAEMELLAIEVIVFRDICRERMQKLNEIRYEGTTGEQLRAEITLYERALDRCNTVLATNVKLGIAERRQQLEEAQALVLVGVIKSILGRLRLSPEQKAIAGEVVPEELRAISAAVSA